MEDLFSRFIESSINAAGMSNVIKSKLDIFNQLEQIIGSKNPSKIVEQYKIQSIDCKSFKKTKNLERSDEIFKALQSYFKNELIMYRGKKLTYWGRFALSIHDGANYFSQLDNVAEFYKKADENPEKIIKELSQCAYG